MKNDSRAAGPVKSTGGQQRDGLVPAVARAIALIDRVAAAGQPLGLAQLSRELGLPKSSAHGICQTLCALRLLRIQGTGFALGPHVLHWSHAFLAKTDVVSEFQALVSGDSRLDSGTVTLSALDGSDVVYLACRNSGEPMSFNFRIGMRLPAIFAATGKAMLARLDEQALAAALPQPWPAAMTRHSVANRKRLLVELDQTRQRGYAIDDGQIREGMVCLGAAISDGSGRVVAGIALSLTAAEATPARIARTGAAIAAIARELSQRVGSTAGEAAL